MPGSAKTHQQMDAAGGGAGGNVNIHDGLGNALTSTVVVADQALDVNVVQSVGGAGGTSSTDGAVFVPGVGILTIGGGEVDDVGPANVAEGSSGAFRMSAERAIHTTLEDGAGNNRRQLVNAAGAAAVEFAGVGQPVVDGGLSLTVDFGGVAQPITDGGGVITVDGGVTADIRDGAGVALTSTLVGADQSLDVNVVQTVGGAGGTSMVDDAAFTPAVTSITPTGAMFDDVAPDSVDEGDAGVLRMSANRNLYVVIRDGAGNERSLNIDALGSLGITNADLVTLAGAVAGGQMQVDVVAALPAGGNNIGDVDVLSVPAPLNLVGGGAEAAALRVTLANDSTGQVALSAAIPAGANNIGDVDVLSVPAPLNVTGNGAAATALRVTQANDSTGQVTITGALPAGANNIGDVDVASVPAPLNVVNNGAALTALRVTLANDSTGQVALSAAIPAGGNNIGDVDILSVPAPLNVVGGGAEATALRVTLANDSTGVVTVDGTVTASNTVGDVADDAVDSGNPVKIGALAKETDGTDPGSVSAEGDRAELTTDRNRRLLVNPAHPNLWSNNGNWAAAQTDTEIQATPGANLSLYITDIEMSAAGACNIKIVRNTAGPTDVIGPFYFAANGGLIKTFATPIRIPANENIGITSSAAVNHTVSVQGYTAP